MKSKRITKQQLLPGIILSVAVSFICFLYAPIEIYCSNLDEFWFGFGVLLKLSFGMFGIAVLSLIIVYGILWLIHPVLYKIGLAGGLILLICTYVQGEFLVKGLPVLDGSAIDWNSYPDLRRNSLILWGITSAAVLLLLFLFKKKKRMFENAVMLVSGCLTLMLLVTMFSIIISTDISKEQSRLYVTEKEEFNMSDDENFVILVLDTVDSREFSSLLEEHSEYREIFQDFTYFENTTGAYACTKNAVPFLLSGEWYEEEEPFIDHVNRVYTQAPLFAELEQRGYQLNLYDNELNTEDEAVISRFGNMLRAEYKVRSYPGLAKQEIKLIGYRYAPYDLKKYCMTRKAGFDEEILVECDYRAFSTDNGVFKDRLSDTETSIDTEQKQFKFYHLDGAHAPYVFDKDCNVIDADKGSYRQSVEASITVTAEYISKLKESGVYDNTVLIVMADHGYNSSEENALMRQSALLLIKGRAEHHDTMEISQAPISYVDLQEAYVRLMDGAESNDAFDWKEGDKRERRFLMDYLGQTGEIVEYIQHGYAQDVTTMEPTGRTWKTFSQ